MKNRQLPELAAIVGLIHFPDLNARNQNRLPSQLVNGIDSQTVARLRKTGETQHGQRYYQDDLTHVTQISSPETFKSSTRPLTSKSSISASPHPVRGLCLM